MPTCNKSDKLHTRNKWIKLIGRPGEVSGEGGGEESSREINRRRQHEDKVPPAALLLCEVSICQLVCVDQQLLNWLESQFVCLTDPLEVMRRVRRCLSEVSNEIITTSPERLSQRTASILAQLICNNTLTLVLSVYHCSLALEKTSNVSRSLNVGMSKLIWSQTNAANYLIILCLARSLASVIVQSPDHRGELIDLMTGFRMQRSRAHGINETSRLPGQTHQIASLARSCQLGQIISRIHLCVCCDSPSCC